MHHKFAIVDKCLVLNGSFNWTRQAVLQNQENCVVTDEPRLVSAEVVSSGRPAIGSKHNNNIAQQLDCFACHGMLS